MGGAITKLGNIIGEEVGGKTGRVLNNLFTYAGNSVDIVMDVASIMTMGGAGAVSTAINMAAGVKGADPSGLNPLVAGFKGAANLIPDIERSAAGIYHGFKGCGTDEGCGWAREKSINSWFDDNVKPYTPRGWEDTAVGWVKDRLGDVATDLAGGKTKKKPVADQLLAETRRFHDMQVREAGNLIARHQLENLTDPGRRFNNAKKLKGRLGDRVANAVDELASAREIWQRADPKEKRRIETTISKELVAERKELASASKLGDPRDISERIIGPSFVTPQATLR